MEELGFLRLLCKHIVLLSFHFLPPRLPLLFLFFSHHDGFSRTHLNGEQTPLTLPESAVQEQPAT